MTRADAESEVARLNAQDPNRSWEVARNATCQHADDAWCRTCRLVGPYYARLVRTHREAPMEKRVLPGRRGRPA